MRWKEIPRDWMWAGDPGPINDEVRAQIGRRRINQDKVAAIIGIKRQALARRLKGETEKDRTHWRWSELKKLNAEWDGALRDIIGENPENGKTVSGAS